jgi:hypothetical protein
VKIVFGLKVMIYAERSFDTLSKSFRDIISTGVCIYRFGTLTKPAATPAREIWIALASVPVGLEAPRF